MVEKPLCVLQINKADIGGGAETIAWNLMHAYRSRGIVSWLAVEIKRSEDSGVLLISRVSNNKRYSWWTRVWLTMANKYSFLKGRVRGWGKVLGLIRLIAQPETFFEVQRGHEDFDYPGSWQILSLLNGRPDILHCHNLHDGYFDLRALPWLSRQIPVLLTLHDAWLLSGHCAHSFKCERWKIGCGQCPDLNIYPAVKRDATEYNWNRKKSIYAKSRLYVAVPSRWLMQKVMQSNLAPAIVESRIIPNGVDLSVFRPGDQKNARTQLNIPKRAKVLLFVGYTTQSNQWKDYPTLESAVAQVSQQFLDQELILVCLGEKKASRQVGRAEARFVAFQSDLAKVACYYQAADLYIHASRADTFPNTVLEALACGIPVVATAVGGIPEQVKDGVTGFLVQPQDSRTMAEHILTLLTDDDLYHQFSYNAAKDARERFDLKRQVDAYIGWYREIIERDMSNSQRLWALEMTSKDNIEKGLESPNVKC